MMIRLLIADDEKLEREALADMVSRRFEHEVVLELAENGRKAADTAVLWGADLILMDIEMPGMSGLALFEQLLQRGLAQAWPVIFLTGHADVPTAVDSVKRGAFDFCEKPFSDNALVDRIEQALTLSEERLAARNQKSLLQQRQSELTERERDVMRLVVEGLPNKLIADQLDISVRTVEVHRARVFDKMEVKSAVELANLLRVQT